MNIKRLSVDSEIVGREIFQIENIADSKEFLEKESSIKSELKPYYIQCLIDASELATIHAMEDAGFRFVEFRFKKQLDINTFQKVGDSAFYPYLIRFIVEDDEFQIAKAIVASSKSDDRFSNDPIVPPELAQKRLQAYLKRSFDNEKEEFVCGLFNRNTNELLAIKTGKLASREVAFYHTAVKENLDTEKFTYMMDALLISQFIDNKIKNFYTVTSGLNLMEMDLHITDLKFRIVSAMVVVRKVY